MTLDLGEPPMSEARRAKKIRSICIAGDVAYVQLTKGYEAIIDAEDLDLIRDKNWYCRVDKDTVYARRWENVAGKREMVYLHRLILSAPNSMHVDHINGNGLDNRKSNLRLASRDENMRNQRVHSNNTTGVKGVSFRRNIGKYQAQIRASGKIIHLGCFENIDSARSAYLMASEKYHGEFRRG
jgi:hypothetical protein